jgi:hypothetical protein
LLETVERPAFLPARKAEATSGTGEWVGTDGDTGTGAGSDIDRTVEEMLAQDDSYGYDGLPHGP